MLPQKELYITELLSKRIQVEITDYRFGDGKIILSEL